MTSALTPDHPIAKHVNLHGDGVRDIALWVDDAREAFSLAVERGAKPAAQPAVLQDDDGEVIIAGIQTYGDTIHSLVERRNYRGVFLPGFHASGVQVPGRAGRTASTWTTAWATSSWAG